MLTLSFAMFGTFQSSGDSTTGVIDLLHGNLQLKRSGSKKESLITEHSVAEGRRVGIDAGDVLRLPLGTVAICHVGRHKFRRIGPVEWIVPKPEDARGELVARPILGRREMGGNDKPVGGESSFHVLGAPQEGVVEWYVEPHGACLAWTALPSVRTVRVTVHIGSRFLGPFTYAAHRRDSPDPRIGWFVDPLLGAKLREEVSDEYIATPATLSLVPDAGRPVDIAILISSKSRSRDLDDSFVDLENAMSKPSGKDDWFDNWNRCLLLADQDLALDNAFWLTRGWGVYPKLYVTRSAFRGLLYEGKQRSIVQSLLPRVPARW